MSPQAQQAQLDRLQDKVDWLVQRFNAGTPPPVPPAWSEAQVKTWLLEQWLSSGKWIAPAGKGGLLQKAIAEDQEKAKGASKKRSYRADASHGSGGYHSQGGSGYEKDSYGSYYDWKNQPDEEDDQTWGKRWR